MMRHRVRRRGHCIFRALRAAILLLSLLVLVASLIPGFPHSGPTFGAPQGKVHCRSCRFLGASRTDCGAARSGSISRASSSEASISLGDGSDSKLAARCCLLAAIPPGERGAPVTNVTLSSDDYERILSLTADLEATASEGENSLNGKALDRLDGDWRLVFSDASEITRLSKLPWGFRLGQVFQPIRVHRGYFENQAAVRHRFGLARASTRVVANFSAAELGSINRVGIVNEKGNRINVRFQNVIFTLHRFFGLPTFGKVRKVATPRGPAEMSGKMPTLDVTYLDDKVRVSRGGDGSVFILSKEESPTPILSSTEAAALAPTTSKAYNAAQDILPTRKEGVFDAS